MAIRAFKYCTIFRAIVTYTYIPFRECVTAFAIDHSFITS